MLVRGPAAQTAAIQWQPHSSSAEMRAPMGTPTCPVSSVVGQTSSPISLLMSLGTDSFKNLLARLGNQGKAFGCRPGPRHWNRTHGTGPAPWSESSRPTGNGGTFSPSTTSPAPRFSCQGRSLCFTKVIVCFISRDASGQERAHRGGLASGLVGVDGCEAPQGQRRLEG